jgi:hypothetical protein
MRQVRLLLLIAWAGTGCHRDIQYPGMGDGRGAAGVGGAIVSSGAGGSPADAAADGGPIDATTVLDGSERTDGFIPPDGLVTPDATDAAPSVVAGARFLFIFYSPHGTVLDSWRPSGSGANFTLSRILSPLAPYQDRVTVIDGLDNVSAPGQPTSTHVDGPRMLLTARATGGPSIDDLFLTRAAHAQIAAGTDVSTRDLLSASSPTPSFVNYDPSNGVPILPAIGVQDLAMQFRPDQIAVPSVPDPADMTDTMQAFVSIATQACSHDDTRSITLLWGMVDGALPLPFSSLTMNQMAEASGASPGREQFVQQQVFIAEQVEGLVASLDQIPVAPGATMLDRSLVMWISETGEASSHSGHDIPVVLIGNLGGALRQGQYLQYVNRTQGDLLLTLAQVAGATTFGDSAIARAPLTELLAP